MHTICTSRASRACPPRPAGLAALGALMSCSSGLSAFLSIDEFPFVGLLRLYYCCPMQCSLAQSCPLGCKTVHLQEYSFSFFTGDSKLPDVQRAVLWVAVSINGPLFSLAELQRVHHRAFKLYRGTLHATITAADAAAAYDELARASRRASPSGRTSGAAARAERAAEGMHHTLDQDLFHMALSLEELLETSLCHH